MSVDSTRHVTTPAEDETALQQGEQWWRDHQDDPRDTTLPWQIRGSLLGRFSQYCALCEKDPSQLVDQILAQFLYEHGM